MNRLYKYRLCYTIHSLCITKQYIDERQSDFLVFGRKRVDRLLTYSNNSAGIVLICFS